MGDKDPTMFETMQFNAFDSKSSETEQIISSVLAAMQEKGYDPLSQIVGYIISGDPTYITSYHNARSLIMRVERDTLLEEIVSFYLKNNEKLTTKV